MRKWALPHSCTMELEFRDRYGGNPPDPKTVCKGYCEGMGFYPSKDKSEWPSYAVPDEIGYVFVKCKACKGTGLRFGPLVSE